MVKKGNQVGYALNPNGIKSLPDSEIKTILRGADDLIMSGGRAMLAKILAGSKDKKLLELELDYSPVYGALKGISQKEILAKVDWLILHHYLAIEYDGRLPMLVYTDKGWDIERETYANELLEKLIDAAENRRYEFVEILKDRNRSLILLLLEKIADSGNKDLITILEAWQTIEFKKVRTRIQEVIDILEKVEEKPKSEVILEVVSFSANKKWLSIPVEFRRKLERNVWCSSCSDVVKIEKYTVKEFTGGIVLEGKCQKCGNGVARVID
ncbi:RQC-minor-1 family DNA-binding protein [Neobacillus sp. SuZ13]|uniref:RQC domain-containing protein n=1 Tax=Neobacillus sp. SuZ13 TaxID=3047875 RepID=UPI0024C064FD|nr:RQC-minor-1 family DNA-binding protein [Neobacillus sp. SuZ13]WHY64996.1 RQC-minor-1 family DNA-binding protein [Neobacillus sp. SuZ13]